MADTVYKIVTVTGKVNTVTLYPGGGEMMQGSVSLPSTNKYRSNIHSKCDF